MNVGLGKVSHILMVAIALWKLELLKMHMFMAERTIKK